MTTLVGSLVGPLYAALREHDALQDYDLVEAPRPPAEPDALAAVAEELELPPDAVELLAAADGWRGFMPGWELLGAAALAEAQAGAATTFDDCETDEETAKAALVIARSENDAGMLFYDRRTRQADGRMQLVEWLYEDRQRYAGIEELFGELLRTAQEGIADEHAARAELEEEWTEGWRARDRAALAEALRARLAAATLPPRLTAERIAALPALIAASAEASASAATLDTSASSAAAAAASAAARAALGEPLLPAALDADDAKLCLTLFLHLRGAPSPDELRRAIAAFRRHFPEPAFPSVSRFSWYAARPTMLAAEDPELDEAIGRPARGGAWGVCVTLGAEEGRLPSRFTRSLAVDSPSLELHVPGPLARSRSSSCLELKLPLATEPARLRALALELADLVPFLFGYAGYGAAASGIPGVTKVYEWSRRCLGLDVRDARLELAALRDSVKNAAWLTLLGAPLVAALRERFGADALAFEGFDVQAAAAAHGLVLTAGALSLGDVAAAAFPIAVAEVDRRICPLRLRGFANDELHSIGGVRFVSTYTAYDGPLGDGFATRDWLERWISPEAHLGPTPLQQGEALLAALDRAAGTSGLPAWQEQRKKARFAELVWLLATTSHGHPLLDETVAALEWAARFPLRPQGFVLAKLFYSLLLRGDLERARPYLGLVPAAAPHHPLLFHNAACICARLGDRAQALAFTRGAKEAGYSAFVSMRTDDDLKSLFGDPEFDALFA